MCLFHEILKMLPINDIFKNLLWKGVPIKIYFVTKLLEVYYKGFTFLTIFSKGTYKDESLSQNFQSYKGVNFSQYFQNTWFMKVYPFPNTFKRCPFSELFKRCL